MERDHLALANQWPSSGLTQKEFCNKHEIKYQTLQYWLRKSRQKKPVEGFVELLPVPVHRESNGIAMELHFANGCKLVFFSRPEVSFIKSLTR